MREYHLESTDDLRIIYQYEKNINQCQKPSERIDDHIYRFGKQRGSFGQELIDMHAFEGLPDSVGIGITLHEFNYFRAIFRHRLLSGRYIPDYRSEHISFFYHRWQKQIDHKSDQCRHLYHREYGRDHTSLGTGEALIENHYRLKQISHETCHKKRQKHIAQVSYKPDERGCYQKADNELHYTVDIPICRF